MPRMHEFGREERLPSYFMNVIQDFLSSVRSDLRVSLKDATHVEVVPVEPYGIAAIDLQGRWRFRDTAVSRAHPGGAAGTYIVWAVGTDQDVLEVPKPFTDETDYTFDLRITNGANPVGVGVEVFERIAEVDWDGVQITALRQLHNSVTGAMLDGAALPESTRISWARQANGGLLADVKLASIGTTQLADEGVTTNKVLNLAITAAKLAAGAVTNEKLGPESVSTAKLQALAVTAAILAVNAVTTEKIANLAVTAAKIAELAIIEAKIADGAVTSRKFKPTTGLVQANGNLALANAYADVPGTTLEITPAVESYLKVTAVFDLEVHFNVGIAEATGTISLDGVDQARVARIVGNAGINEQVIATCAQTYLLTLSAAKHTIKMRGKKLTSSGAAEAMNLQAVNTCYLYELVAK